MTLTFSSRCHAFGNHQKVDFGSPNSPITPGDAVIAARRRRIAGKRRNWLSTTRRLTRGSARPGKFERSSPRLTPRSRESNWSANRFAPFAQSWLAAKRHEVAESTLEFYKKAADKFLTHLGPLADADLAEISREHVLDFRNREAEKFAPKTVNHDLKAVKMLFLAAKRDGLIADNPAEDVKTVAQRGEKRSRRPFSLDELRSVLSVADDEWRSMILFGLYTGARLSDVASLTWENVDLPARELRFIAKKTGKTIILPLDGPLAAHVEALPAADSPRTPLHPRAFSIVEKQGKTGHLSNQFADLLAQAGLRKKQPHRKTNDKEQGRRRRNEGLSFHCLRHTAVTLLKEAGIPQAVVMELVGHDNEEMSQHYTRVGRTALEGAARAFPDLLAR